MAWVKSRYDFFKTILTGFDKRAQLDALINELNTLEQVFKEQCSLDEQSRDTRLQLNKSDLPLPTEAMQPFLIWSSKAPPKTYEKLVQLHRLIDDINSQFEHNSQFISKIVVVTASLSCTGIHQLILDLIANIRKR